MKLVLKEDNKRPYFVDEKDKWDYEINKYANDKSLLPEQNKLLIDYKKFLSSQGNIGKRTMHNNIKYVYYFFKHYKKPIKKITKKEILDYASYVNQNTPKSFNMYMSGVNLFFRRFLNKKELVEDVIKWKRSKGNGKLPEEMLKPEEIEKMVNKCSNTRDKAIIMVLYDSGCRVGELINLKLKHIQEDEYGIKIMFTGKTGMRRLRLTSSVPFLKEWLNIHPYKEDPESPVFVNQSTNHFGEVLKVQGINKLLKVWGSRAGIKKNIYPHLLRHSRFTELAKDYTEQELKVLAGWVGDSTMPKVYVHLSGEDVERKILIKNGLLKDEIIEKEEEKKKLLQPRICPDPICKYKNPYSNKYCAKCHRPLDILTIIEQEKKFKNINERIDKYSLGYMQRGFEDRELDFENYLEKLMTNIIKKELNKDK
ncbi:MAG: Phage integrase protein [archaeon GW2011_AR20]|nr:MAG: Phage integrase protein [archaeon GW2011_AR20]MBS3161048.1 tyrosine-type recombinase/integrase [Candidatus Woesearchaeota archaeon]